MKSKLTKYGMMTIAAVLLVTVAFAGAASAEVKYGGTLDEVQTYIDSGYDVQLTNEITISTTSELDLKGHTVMAASGKRLFMVTGTSTVFTLDDTSDKKTGKLTGGNADVGGGVYICFGGTFTMNGGTITGCSAIINDGGGVYVYDSGIFTMNGGNITECSANRDGGGVYVMNCCTFTMNGGNITECSASQYGGGVLVYPGGTFTLTDGNITECSAGSGGGVYVMVGGKFILTGGDITGCSANQYGGGVYVYENGIFTLTGGDITGCSAGSGGGVYVKTGSFTMNGGTITGCSATYGNGGGVYVNIGTFNVNGTATITGNTKGSDTNNVYLKDADNLTLLTGGFTGRIGIYGVNGPPSLGTQFGTAEDTTATGAENFTNDKGGLAGYIDTQDGNKLKWTTGCYTASQWNTLDDAAMKALSGTVYIVDTDENAVIYPKYNDSNTPFAIANDLTLDFTGYKGKFSGEPSATTDKKGALFGYIHYNGYTGGTLTIKNLTMKDTTVATTGEVIGGIIGYFNGEMKSGRLNITNCCLENCSVNGTSSSSSFVGGLVGVADGASVNVEGCKVMHCEIVAGRYNVGGLVGEATTVSFVGGNVTNSTIAGSDNVGGLVGFAKYASFESCGVENASVYASSSYVGGLLGKGHSLVDKVGNSTVKNCVVAGSYCVGGLVSHAPSARGITNSAVQNTAVNGTEFVGGLVGMIGEKLSECSNNAVKNSAVNGGDNTNLDCGYLPTGDIECTATASHLNNGTAGQPLITVYSHTVTPQPAPTQYGYLSIANLTGVGLPTATKTAVAYVAITEQPLVFDPCNESSATYTGTIQLGNTMITAEIPVRVGYSFSGWNLTSSTGTLLTDKGGILQASVSGYTNASSQWNNASGVTVNLFANWTVNTSVVSVDSMTNGSVNAMPNGSVSYGTAVTLTNASDSGYHFVQYDIYKTGSSEEKVENSSNKFTMPDYAVNVSGIFAGNTTTVTFYNLSTPLESKINTYNTATNATTTVPARAGYTFVGWNVSDGGSWYAFNSDIYNKSGIWNYTGVHDGTLDVFANWTASEYTITNTSSDPIKGSTTVNKTGTAKYLDSVEALASANAGYHFVNWTCVNLSSTEVTENPYIFVMPAKNVGITANFAANVSTVTFQNASGVTYDTKMYTFNESAALPTPEPAKEGYTFTGWNITVGGIEYPFSDNTTYFNDGKWVYPCANDSSFTVNASWTSILYTIDNSSVVNGLVLPDKTQAILNERVNVTQQADLGYHFDNWNVTDDDGTKIAVVNESFIMPAKNVSAHANFTANVTTVVFHNDSWTESKLNTYGEATNLTENPTKEGYTLAGWNVSSTSGDSFNSSSYNNNGIWNYTGADEGTLNVYANWTVVNKTVTPEGGTSTINEPIVPLTPGEEVIFSEVNGTHTSVTFEASSGAAGYPAGPSRGHGDLSVLGTFNLSISNPSGVQKVTLNVTFANATEDKKNESVYLKHWTDGVWDIDNIAPSHSHKLSSLDYTYQYTFAVSKFSPFSIVLETPIHTVIHDVNNSYEFEATFNSATVVPNGEFSPSEVGKIFNGWYDVNGVAVINASKQLVNSLYTTSAGLWNYTSTTLNVYENFTGNVTTVVFHTDAGTEDKLNTFGQAINFSANPTKSGYTFTYWNVSSTGLDLNSSTYVIDGTTWNYTGADKGTLDVFANWTPITYTVHFDANGGQGSMDDMTFTYDEGQNLTENAFQRYNSNFLYWTTDDGTRYYDTEFVQNLTTEDGGNVTMTAQWETYSTGGSSSGTSYLGSNDASYTPTEQPTVNPTAKPTEMPATPSVVATANPTTQPTQQSPAPFVGILAGLGAAAVVLRLRK